MKVSLLLLALCVCAAFAGPFGFEPRIRTALGNKVDKASVKMLKNAYLEAKDKNVVMSPLAVLMLLNLCISNSENSKVQDEILELLGEKTSRDAYNRYQELAYDFADGRVSALNFKNKVYVSKDYTLTDKFVLNARGLRSEVENVNFHDVKSAVANINAWAEKETKGHIKSAISEDELDHATVTALFNVIFFEGHWHVPFNASETENKDFHVDKKTTVKKPMMKLTMPLQYGENKELGARFVELPYKENDFRMVVALPDEVDGLPNVVEKISTKGFLDDVFELSTGTSEINLELPRFEIKADLKLNRILEKMGVKSIFSNPIGNIVKERSVVVDKVFQKAFVKVDEEGATAGAFTGAIMVPTSSFYQPPPPIQFIVDRPFAFAILYRDIILFTGTYTH